MTAIYTWEIPQLDVYPTYKGKPDVVYNIHWIRRAVDGAYSSEAYGTESITFSGPFTPYSELTKAQVEGWLVEAMGSDNIARVDNYLAETIQDQINPPSVSPVLPW